MRHVCWRLDIAGHVVLLPFVISHAVSGSSGSDAFTVFRAPASGTDSAQGTSAQCINDDGEIAGQYIDAEGAVHGFVRHKDGTFTAFDAPGASKKPGSGTFPRSISKAGEVAGYFESDPNGTRHGFVRHRNGAFTPFDPSGSAGTVAQSINENGATIGNYVSDAAHGFVRDRDGTFLTIDPPGSYNTGPQNINGRGEITGYYEDVIGVLRGFLRHADGTFDVFSVPSASREKGEGTYATSMNDEGEITGYYNAGPYHATHGFLRRKNGTIVTFEPPGSITDAAAHQDEEGYLVRPVTVPTSINNNGEVVGYYGDATGVLHGFARMRDGTFRTFEAPNANKHSDLGTSPMDINGGGEIAGYYYSDPDGVLHGFVLNIPQPSAAKTSRGKSNSQ